MGSETHQDVTLKKIYGELIKEVKTKPRIFIKYFEPNGIDGGKVFRSLTKAHFSNEAREVVLS